MRRAQGLHWAPAMPFRIRLALAALAAILATGIAPVFAGPAHDPTAPPDPYVRWSYPAQIPNGPIETGQSDLAEAAPNGFLTLPFNGPHYVTALFDHCGANYVSHGRICRYDGAIAYFKSGQDPEFGGCYALTPAQKDYLCYDGHDGYDFGLYYEQVLAAAPGQVTTANWISPDCHTCSSGQTVIINHGNGLQTYYGHLSSIAVGVGQHVARGQVLGISGRSGSATGEHLHFGVYKTGGRGAVDPYGWKGDFSDPWPGNVGDLWLGGSPRFPDTSRPQVSVSALVLPSSDLIDVSWGSPGGGDVFTVQVVEDDLPAAPWLGRVTAGSARFLGRPGHSYWFWATVTTDLGYVDGGASGTVRLGGPQLSA